MAQMERRSRQDIRARLLLTCMALAALAFASVSCQTTRAADEAGFTPTDKPNSPMGVARGINPGRVVWAHDPAATDWDGKADHWWDDTHANQKAVDEMMSRALLALTGEKTEPAAWEALFRHFNKTHGYKDAPYQPGEKIAVKVNLNNSGGGPWGNGANASPQMIRALLYQLVQNAKVPQADIAVYDASRRFGPPILNKCHAEFPEVRFVERGLSAAEKEQLAKNPTAQYRPAEAEPDKTVAIHYADPQVLDSGKTYLPKCVTEAKYLINFALLKGHNVAGVTLNAKNHFGSVWRERDVGLWNMGWSPGNMHCFVSVRDWTECKAQKMGAYNALVELMGHKHLDGKAVLFLIDGLYGAPHQGCEPQKWQSAPFNGDWTSSLFVSQDEVAIESVALDFMRSEPTLREYVRGPMDNYLHEAALADKPPSGAAYDPEGDGTRLESLGAHEHWNNAQARQYSRNLGTGKGIELTPVPPSAAK